MFTKIIFLQCFKMLLTNIFHSAILQSIRKTNQKNFIKKERSNMFYDVEELEKRDNIEVMEEQKKKNSLLFVYALYASVMKF